MKKILATLIVALGLTFVGTSAALADDAPAPAVKPAVAPATTIYRWIMPAGGTATNVTWPQAPYTDAAITAIPCGETRTIQIDTYRYESDQDVKTVDALDDDGTLVQGEDSSVVTEWRYEDYTAPACQTTPTPEPTDSASPAPAPVVTVAPAVSAQLDANKGEVMAETGPRDTLMLLSIAGALAVVGVTTILLTRRTRRN